MKKNIIFAIAILMQCGLLSGQTAVQTALAEDPVTGYACGIFRSWGNHTALAYHVRDGKQLFSVIDSALGTVYSAVVPNQYTVRDFRVVGDTAYCCGSMNSTAMLAYFNINEILAAPTVNFQVALITDLRMVTKIAAYRKRGTPYVGIAAIGEEVRHADSYDYLGFHMIWCNNFSGGLFAVTTKECDNSWDLVVPSEKLSDVVMTERYVVFVGIYTNTKTLCIRRGDKGGIFSTPLIDTVHRYAYHVDQIESLPIAEPLGKDDLAVAIACEDVLGRQLAQINLFDMSNMVMDNMQWMKISDGLKGSVNELVYMPNHRQLLVAAETDAGHQVIYTQPSATGTYLAKTLAPATGDVICSMDRHNGSYYILSTLRHWMLQKMGAMPPDDTCIVEDHREVFMDEVSMDGPIYINKSLSSAYFFSQILQKTGFAITVYCSKVL